jgi:hypothetical protein
LILLPVRGAGYVHVEQGFTEYVARFREK